MQILGLAKLQQTYVHLKQQDQAVPIAERLLRHIQVTYKTALGDMERVPRTGATLVVANHPFGILEGAVLATLLTQLRPDVKFLANSLLTAIPELANLIIPVDLENPTARNGAGMRKALQHLDHHGMLVIFPAGEVSHFQWKLRATTDPEWNPAVARLIELAARRNTQVAVVPIHIAGSNSTAFQAAGFLHPKARTLLLVRELFNKQGKTVDLRIGKPIPAERILSIQSNQERIEYLRWKTYLLANRNDFKPNTAKPMPVRAKQQQEPIASETAKHLVAGDVAALRESDRLAVSGDLEVYLAKIDKIPAVLREIARLREITFRAAGEGTGKPLDIDRFDQHYLHLFVWNSLKHEIVGAYRLAPTDIGHDNLYTATLFQYNQQFLQRMGPAVELGRSFIRAEYQKAFAPLLLLWKGIGSFVKANPQYKILFGPVSISNQYQAISRDLMISFLEKRETLHDWMDLIQARNAPPKTATQEHCSDLEDLHEVVSELEPGQTGIPVLLRQYLRLGGKLLGFNIDPEFSDTLDGLILVDLRKTEPKLLQRYMGKQ